VATQVLNQFEIESSQPFMLRDILPGAAWAPYRAPICAVANDMECAIEANEVDGNCVKGFVVAISLEGAMALGVFGLWHFWRLLR
jgi:hypothetical protein